MNYCCTCGAPISVCIPPGDTLPRHVCTRCGAIHYRNPRLVVGTLPVWEDRILLCRRAIEPRHGCWTLPAGFMENQETLAAAALRETREEACARVELDPLYTMISVPHISQVHAIFRARLLDLDFAAGHETLEVALFEEAGMPWEDIAFPTIAMTLRHFFADRRRGSFDLHVESLALPKQSPPYSSTSKTTGSSTANS
ncbi:MAG: NUDIX hydrolase [Rhodocyclaceae bacterium]|nr:NUDIX hydrolase [Rhodocyclaceae bacterium]